MQLSIFDGTEQSLLNKSLELLKSFEEAALFRNPNGYIVGYSGGKDSDVLVHLFKRAGVKFCIVHNHTTLDAPETVYYIRKKFAEWSEEGIYCKIIKPQLSFWQLCVKRKMLPLRQARFCCSELKERDVPELRFAVRSFGVRKAESVRRAMHRDSIETRNKSNYSDTQRFHFDNTEDVKQSGACYTNSYFYVNPLAYWSDDYLWGYIESEKIEVNPLYGRGYHRVGCIGCPMVHGNRRALEFEKYPRYKKLFLHICDKIVLNKQMQDANPYRFKSGQEYFDWWMSDESMPSDAEYGLLGLSEENRK